ncbi:hypothetical protein ABOM_002329 [Aspergillus bombycis]|uniref:Peptidase metallopeptidase domain-containing protein n=1 Tax=Aspergillus bombycis TaxID=109264 RepID=A0A1F8ABE2_9EURO|nr:hypothetical protein ABOM_002329 [Aspergillus bombycis]OGM49024.1 hypothetical protein ABOM_002329 [Aspergillus bombycis]
MATGFALNLLFLLSLFFASLSNAGHPAWEAGATTVTSEWIHIDPSWEFPTWPSETIRYYFNSPTSKERLSSDIRAAWQLWYAAGLPETFRFVEFPKWRCEREPDSCLRVIGDEEEVSFYTSIAKQRIDPWDRIAMYVVFEGNEDEFDRALMIAHEIGHAWGLIHEHQNPLYWQWAYYDTRPDSLFQFYCANVIGYDEIAHQINNTRELWSENGPCRSQLRALEMGFYAADIIPWQSRYQSPHHLWPHDSDVDWDSIMIYGSYFFGAPDEQGNNKVTLLRMKGLQVIPEPSTVTEFDIFGMLHLYHPKWGKFLDVFHNDESSPWYTIFQGKIKSCPIKT